jgi:phosphatidylserine/phosphatidylglycerophosphate/cardiolipin synthase-like enzyme
MKKPTILALVFLGIATFTNAQTTILEARAKAIGTVVTVTGIVTNGAELGNIRYFQDNTAGIAAYGDIPIVNNILIGDSVTITGTLKSYNQLIELDPTTSVVVKSSGNPVPEPIILTPVQLMEAYEARLVKINNVTFPDAGGVFTAKKYAFTSNGEPGYLYIKSTQTDIVGQPIPSGVVNLSGILSQFDYSNPTVGYQVLPRTIADIQKTSSIYLISALSNTNFTQAELDFSWTTNITGTTEMFYGSSATDVKSNYSTGTGDVTSHTIALSGFSAGQVIWTQAFSVNGSDTAFSGIMPFATISNSSGDIKVYFNTAVDNSYSTGVDALDLSQAIDDTLINYINRAKYSIDLIIYNFNNDGLSNISNALKAAANRGLTVRVIGCGTTANYGIDELAGSAVNTFIGPNTYNRTGIMHNKFILFDTESADANDPLVWTGSTNLTADQINLDANNVIILQDQSLARAYKIEFEEMWGSTGSTPNATNARFGFNKKNNTPHEFVINGKRVECYFSPTDGVNAQIIQHINTTNNDLSIATMLLTRDEIASAIASSKATGATVNMLTDASGNNGASVNTTLLAALGVTHYIFYTVSPGIMHNKYMIVDQGAFASDPLVLTGSHNWSAAADNDNDENTLVIHDATIANIYYQNFVKLFVDNNGVLTGLSDLSKTSANSHLLVYPNPVQNGSVSVFCSLPSADKGTMQLFDVTGKLVYESSIKLTNGNNSLKYNFPHSYKGMYLLRLKTGKNVWNQKILFE